MKFSGIIDKLKQYPVAVICAVLLIGFIMIIFLRGGLVSDLSVKEADLNSRIRTIEQNIVNSNNIEQEVEDLSVIVEKIESLLFDRYERAININFFYGFEDSAGVVISDINQLPDTDPIYAEGGPRKLDLHSTLVFNITLSGRYSNILKFLYELDQVDPLIRVADFQISRSSGEMGQANVDARMRILVLAKKD